MFVERRCAQSYDPRMGRPRSGSGRLLSSAAAGGLSQDKRQEAEEHEAQDSPSLVQERTQVCPAIDFVLTRSGKTSDHLRIGEKVPPFHGSNAPIWSLIKTHADTSSTGCNIDASASNRDCSKVKDGQGKTRRPRSKPVPRCAAFARRNSVQAFHPNPLRESF